LDNLQTACNKQRIQFLICTNFRSQFCQLKL